MTPLTDEQIDAVFDAHEQAPHMAYRYLVARAILDAAAPKVEDEPSPDASSRAMFVARLEAVPKDNLVSPNWVLALLNDCDMLADRETRALGNEDEARRLSGAAATDDTELLLVPRSFVQAVFLWAYCPIEGGYDDGGMSIEDTCEELGAEVEALTGVPRPESEWWSETDLWDAIKYAWPPQLSERLGAAAAPSHGSEPDSPKSQSGESIEAAPTETERWLSVEKLLPTPYEVVLGFAGSIVTVVRTTKPAHQEGGFGWRIWPTDEGNTPWLDVSHWMPLPEVPSGSSVPADVSDTDDQKELP